MGRKLTKAQIQVRDEAIQTLRGHINPGDDVYVNIQHVSRSGMSRDMRLYIINTDYPVNQVNKKPVLWDITGLAARAMSSTRAKNGWDIRVGGCGMDMAFHIVYNLGRTLFPDGGPLDASRRKDQESRTGQDRERDGGYLLNKRDI